MCSTFVPSLVFVMMEFGPSERSLPNVDFITSNKGSQCLVDPFKFVYLKDKQMKNGSIHWRCRYIISLH